MFKEKYDFTNKGYKISFTMKKDIKDFPTVIRLKDMMDYIEDIAKGTFKTGTYQHEWVNDMTENDFGYLVEMAVDGEYVQKFYLFDILAQKYNATFETIRIQKI